MTLVTTSIPFNVCLHAFVLISALRWLAENWQLSKWGDIGELEVEFKFQRRSCKRSFFFPPCNQSAPESLHSGYRSLCKSELCAVSFSFLKWQVPRHLKVGLKQFRFTSLFNQHLGVLVSVPSSLSGKHFHLISGKGFLVLLHAYETRAKKWKSGTSGRNEMLADKPQDFENLCSPANGAPDWLS